MRSTKLAQVERLLVTLKARWREALGAKRWPPPLGQRFDGQEIELERPAGSARPARRWRRSGGAGIGDTNARGHGSGRRWRRARRSPDRIGEVAGPGRAARRAAGWRHRQRRQGHSRSSTASAAPLGRERPGPFGRNRRATPPVTTTPAGPGSGSDPLPSLACSRLQYSNQRCRLSPPARSGPGLRRLAGFGPRPHRFRRPPPPPSAAALRPIPNQARPGNGDRGKGNQPGANPPRAAGPAARSLGPG